MFILLQSLLPEIRHSGSLNWHPFILNGLVTFKPRVTGQPPSSNMTLLDPFGVVPIFFVNAVASFEPGVAWQVTVALTFSLSDIQPNRDWNTVI